MTNNEYVERLYKRKDELIRICNFNGLYNQTDIDDLLQDIYLILLQFKNIDRYTIDNEINMYIIFAIIKNAIYSKNKKVKLLEFNNDRIEIENDEYNLEKDSDIELKLTIVNSGFTSMNNWFNKTIIELLYFKDELVSIRQLAKDTTISNTTLQKISVKYRNDCKEQYLKIKNNKNTF